MGDREAKLRRLNSFRRKLPHASASALSAILTTAADEGLPDLHSRSACRAARDLDSIEITPYGPINGSLDVVDSDGTPRSIPIANPLAFLWIALSTSAPFRAFFQSRMDAHPPSPERPWGIVIYSDEVTPGDAKQPNPKRKFQALYWTLLELGVNALSREAAWFPIMTEYSQYINKLAASLSQAFSEAIKSFFPPEGFNLAVSGITLPLDGDNRRLFAILRIMLQDGGAFKQTFHHRGDAASKLCLLCKNLFTASSEIVDNDGSMLLRCNVIKRDELVPATDADLRNTYRYVEGQAHVLGAEAFKALQQALGVTHHPRSIMLDRYLDAYLLVTQIYLHDWMHALLVDGVFNDVLLLLLNHVQYDGAPNVWELLEGYVARWHWPALCGSTAGLAEVFSPARKKSHKDSGHIKCPASGLLSLYPVIAVFVCTILLPAGQCVAACNAFLALCDVLDVITAVNRTNVPPARLLAAVEGFLARFVAVWGDEHLGPKYHWLLHFPAALARYGCLLSCFVLERKHRVAKRYGTDSTLTSRQASSTLIREVTSHQLAMMQDPWLWSFDVGLIRPRTASPTIRRALDDLIGLEVDTVVRTAVESRFSPVATCNRGDMVLIRTGRSFQAAHIMFHADIDGVAVSLVNTYSLVRADPHTGIAEWDPLPDPELVEASDILDTVVYTRLGGGRVRTIVPAEFR